MDTDTEAIRYKKIFLLWVPLAVMWIFMAFELMFLILANTRREAQKAEV